MEEVKDLSDENLTCFLCTGDLNTNEASSPSCICFFRMCHCCWFRVTNNSQRCPGCRRNIFIDNETFFRNLHPSIQRLFNIRNDGLNESISLDLLNAVAYFKPNVQIPIKLFEQLLEDIELRLAITELENNSFIITEESGGCGSFSIQSTDQALIQRCFNSSDGIRICAKAIQLQFGLLAWQKDLNLIELTFPHALVLWDHIASDPQFLKDYLYMSSTILYAFDIHGNSKATLDFSILTMRSIRKQFGEGSIESIVATYQHAFALMKVYKYTEALEFLDEYMKVLDRNETIHNSQLVSTLCKIGSCVAYCLCELGKPKDAVLLYERIKTIIETGIRNHILNEETISHVMSTMLYRKAKALIRLDRDDEAMANLNEALLTNITNYSIRSPKTTLVMKHIASIHTKKGNFHEALHIYNDVYQIEQEVLKVHHQHNLITITGMAIVYTKMGNPMKAQKLCSIILQEYNGFESSDNVIELLMVKRELAQAFLKMKRYALARALFQEILDRKLEFLGEKHPFISSALKDIEKLKFY